MIAHVKSDMERVYRELADNESEFHLYLTSRKLEYMDARHIVRYSLIEKHGVTNGVIDQVEREILGQSGCDLSKIRNSVSAVKDRLKRDRPRLYKYIQTLIYLN